MISYDICISFVMSLALAVSTKPMFEPERVSLGDC